MSEVVKGRAAGEGFRFLSRQRLAEYVIVAAIVVEAVVFASLTPQFLSVPNLINVALSIAITGILAVGMTMVILTGGIDLSVGSVVALAGVVAATLAASSGGTGGVVLGVLVALAIGVGVGLFDGLVVAHLRVPPFVATLAMLTICRGLAFVISGGRSIGDLPAGFTFAGRESVLGLPLPVILMALVFVGGWFLLRRTVIGRYIYAVGGNPRATFFAGVNIRRVLVLTYVLNGLLVGLAGFVLASRLGAGVPNSGIQYELDVIAAVVVGGTSLTGGQGSVVGTFWGAVFIGVLNNGLNLFGVDPYMQKIALGVVLLLAVFADQAGKVRGAAEV
jgi:ribose/xylose/arabinose/galactoside ABC-type transport system permease subunit